MSRFFEIPLAEKNPERIPLQTFQAFLSEFVLASNLAVEKPWCRSRVFLLEPGGADYVGANGYDARLPGE